LNALAYQCTFRNKESISELGMWLPLFMQIVTDFYFLPIHLLASWLCHKFFNDLRKRDTAKNELKQLFEKQNPYAEGNIKYSTDFFQAQWVRQAGCKGQRTEYDEKIGRVFQE
jgi:hypothetical protein